MCGRAAPKDSGGKNQNEQANKDRKAPGRLRNVLNKMLCTVSTFFGSETFSKKEIAPLKNKKKKKRKKALKFLTSNQEVGSGDVVAFPQGLLVSNT